MMSCEASLSSRAPGVTLTGRGYPPSRRMVLAGLKYEAERSKKREHMYYHSIEIEQRRKDEIQAKAREADRRLDEKRRREAEENERRRCERLLQLADKQHKVDMQKRKLYYNRAMIMKKVQREDRRVAELKANKERLLKERIQAAHQAEYQRYVLQGVMEKAATQPQIFERIEQRVRGADGTINIDEIVHAVEEVSGTRRRNGAISSAGEYETQRPASSRNPTRPPTSEQAYRPGTAPQR